MLSAAWGTRFELAALDLVFHLGVDHPFPSSHHHEALRVSLDLASKLWRDLEIAICVKLTFDFVTILVHGKQLIRIRFATMQSFLPTFTILALELALLHALFDLLAHDALASCSYHEAVSVNLGLATEGWVDDKLSILVVMTLDL